jgi:hypothetical protein
MYAFFLLDVNHVLGIQLLMPSLNSTCNDCFSHVHVDRISPSHANVFRIGLI